MKIILIAICILLGGATGGALQAQTRGEAESRQLVLEVVDQVNSITGDAALSKTLVSAAAAQTTMLGEGRSFNADELRFIFSRIANNLALLTIDDNLTLKDLNRLQLYEIDGLAYLSEATGKEPKAILKLIREDRVRSKVAARLIAEAIIRKHTALEKAKEN